MTPEELVFMQTEAFTEAALSHRPVCMFNHPYFPDERFVFNYDDGVKQPGLEECKKA